MANVKLPAEIHLIQGTKGMNQGIVLPASLKARIPFAEWGRDATRFTKRKFVKETAEFLFTVYGIGSKQDRHSLTMLADLMDTYIKARAILDTQELVVPINNGATLVPNPYLAVANEAMKNVVRLMNELGLTPKSRFANGAPKEGGSVAKFLQGPMAVK